MKSIFSNYLFLNVTFNLMYPGGGMVYFYGSANGYYQIWKIDTTDFTVVKAWTMTTYGYSQIFNNTIFIAYIKNLYIGKDAPMIAGVDKDNMALATETFI